MFRALLLLGMLMPTLGIAGDLFTCEQQQEMCKATCEITQIGDEKGFSTCSAKCLGKRVSCSLGKGAEKLKASAASAKAASEDEGAGLKDKVKAFWEGFSGNPTNEQ